MFGSDYSGQHRNSDYFVYAFLIVDADNSQEYPHFREHFRDIFLPDKRRMSYKQLNDALRQKSLVPFLTTSDSLSGLCCVFVVNKCMQRMSTSPSSLSIWQNLHGTAGHWGVPAFENMTRIAHFFCLLLSVVSKPHQYITWITDQDEIIANDDRHTDVLNFVARITGLYIDHTLEELAVNSTQVDPGDCSFEDFVAVPDLIAGTFAEIVTALGHKRSWRNNQPSKLEPGDVQEKADLITRWFYAPASKLRKCAIIIDQASMEQWAVRKLDVLECA